MSASFSAPSTVVPDRPRSFSPALRESQPAKASAGWLGLALELRAVERPDDGVRVARRLVGVDDEARLRAAAGGLLELERPAAVIGERLAAEELRVVRGRLVREEDDDLALHVNAL